MCLTIDRPTPLKARCLPLGQQICPTYCFDVYPHERHRLINPDDIKLSLCAHGITVFKTLVELLKEAPELCIKLQDEKFSRFGSQNLSANLQLGHRRQYK